MGFNIEICKIIIYIVIMEMVNMDLDFEILEYERYAKIGANQVFLEIGSKIPVRREHIAQDPESAYNRIVECEIIGFEKHEVSGTLAIQIKADGYRRNPFISVLQIKDGWDDEESPRPNRLQSLRPPVTARELGIGVEPQPRPSTMEAYERLISPSRGH